MFQGEVLDDPLFIELPKRGFIPRARIRELSVPFQASSWGYCPTWNSAQKPDAPRTRKALGTPSAPLRTLATTCDILCASPAARTGAPCICASRCWAKSCNAWW